MMSQCTYTLEYTTLVSPLFWQHNFNLIKSHLYCLCIWVLKEKEDREKHPLKYGRLFEWQQWQEITQLDSAEQRKKKNWLKKKLVKPSRGTTHVFFFKTSNLPTNVFWQIVAVTWSNKFQQIFLCYTIPVFASPPQTLKNACVDVKCFKLMNKKVQKYSHKCGHGRNNKWLLICTDQIEHKPNKVRLNSPWEIKSCTFISVIIRRVEDWLAIQNRQYHSIAIKTDMSGI